MTEKPTKFTVYVRVPKNKRITTCQHSAVRYLEKCFSMSFMEYDYEPRAIMFFKTKKKLNNSNIFCRENHIYSNYEIMTLLQYNTIQWFVTRTKSRIERRIWGASWRYVFQVSVVHIIVENLLSYISTNFYRTQPTFGDAMTKMQGLGFFGTRCIFAKDRSFRL